jgi:hypothetical protein
MRPDDVRNGRAANEHTRSGSRRVTDQLLHLGLGVTSPRQGGDLPCLWSADARLRGYVSRADAVPAPREEVARCRGLIT